MATAIVIKQDIEYTLVLNQDEAQVLLDLLGCTVLGSPDNSRRGVANDIYAAMLRVGGDLLHDRPKDLSGTVTFASKTLR